MVNKDSLKIDCESVVAEIERFIRATVVGTLKRRGAVVGISGGVDSAVVAGLCARALGDNVLGIFMPERDSSGTSLRLGKMVAERFDITTTTEDIAPALLGAGCYERQIEAIRAVFPEYGEGWKCKVSLPSLLDGERLNVFRLTVQNPAGELLHARMPTGPFLQLIAATNYKQRMRTMTEYYHADRLVYAVAGTPNRLEYDQGFFVKQGDGAADFKPIAHLYKSQVFAIAEYLGVPEEIRKQAPTTDTYSLPQTQEEFYFALPSDRMDICLHAYTRAVAASDLAPLVELTTAQVERVYRDIEAKRRAAQYLHAAPILFSSP